MESSKLLRGTFLLTLGTIISKVLGMLYVIPFYHIVGEKGNALYSMAYIPYSIFISIATAGLPLAVAKFVSKYNSLEEYAVGRKLFKSGLIMMSCTGIVAFVILYFFAPILAAASIPDNADVSVQDGTTVIRAVSFGLLIVPFMSLIRGFFQGHQSMGPSAVSQVVEQIVRVIFMLSGAYIILNLLKGSLVTAVSVATFAAFIGAVGSLVVLLWYWSKRKPHLNKLLLENKGAIDVSLKEIYKEIIVYAIPFIFVGLANPLFQFIDELTFKGAMESIGLKDQVVTAFGVLTLNTHKLVIIPVSLATAFSLTLVPAITKAYTEKDHVSLVQQVNQTIQIVLFFTLPAVVGLSLLAEPVYTLFYHHKELGTDILRIYAPVAILFSLFSITAAVLQGINKQKYTIISLLVGLIVKLCLNIPLIKIFATSGAVIATSIGYLVAIIINFYAIKKFAGYSLKLVINRVLQIGFFTLVMFIGTLITYMLLTLFLSTQAKLDACIIVIVCMVVGISIYFCLSVKSNLIIHLFGERAIRVIKKLNINKSF
ncbi:putative polysaccharide biosynthesis protein [Niallia sp. FSL M8-0099]|uniref:putative polysaccharide biosynthesis protein n=1 Tax=Niallia sp. FSL M8-0099 TaxID=2954519 RepID=UPI0030F7C35D